MILSEKSATFRDHALRQGKSVMPRASVATAILAHSLHPCSPCGRFRPLPRRRTYRQWRCRPCCRSSVVEHSLGKGEVDSSILSGSTTKSPINPHFLARPLPFCPSLGT